MSRNLARQTLRNLHSDCFTMILTAGFYCDSRAHNVQKVRVVKYIVVYGQIKAGFGDNLDDFWPRYFRAKVLDLSRVVEEYL